MEDNSPTDPTRRGDRIRRLGFNPQYLTPEEQRELLDLDARMSSSARELDEARPER